MNRLKQPSTFAGMGLLFQMLGVVFPAYTPILQGLTAAAGGLAVILNEQKPGG